MRTSISGLVLMTLAAVSVGCSSNKGTNSGAQSAVATSKAEAGKACVMHAGGRDVLRVSMPADTECKAEDGVLQIRSRDGYVYVWVVRGANSVDDAVGRVGDEIKSEFKDFKATTTSALTVAGAPAKRLMGSGTEADDGDPGTADVVVFKTGEHVFVACTHGESIPASAQAQMMRLVQTAQAP
jgi:hypothetical protein